MAKKAKARKARVRKTKRAARRTSSKKAKTVAKARKARTRKARAKKVATKKGVTRKTAARAAAAGKRDIRIPISGDPDHEIICKWNAAAKQYDCRQVSVGGGRPKARASKPVLKKGIARTAMMATAGRPPNKRVPIRGDRYYEILCKWSAADNQYDCRQVPIGGDW